MKAGRIDAAEAIQPFVDRMKATGDVSLGDPLLVITDPTFITLWMAQGAWAKENRPMIRKWIASLDEAKTYIAENNDATRSIIAKYTRLPEAVVRSLSISHYDALAKPEMLSVWITALRDLGQLSEKNDSGRLVLSGD